MPDANPAVSESWPLATPPDLREFRPPPQMQALTIHRGMYGPPARAIQLEMVPTPVLGPMMD